MSWATHYIEELKKGKTVSFQPRGGSMKGRVNSGALVVCVPVSKVKPDIDDVVLCHVKGNDYLHLVKDVGMMYDGTEDRYEIGNNLGRINGWITIDKIYGVCVSIDGKATKAAKRCLPE